MNRFHINGIEYYDWQALHHEPLPPKATRQAPGTWTDWAGHEIDGATVRNYIREAHDRNMVNMAYNMIYAGTDSFVKDADQKTTQAAKWQIYFAQENHVFDVFDFDGWHGDTVGDWEKMADASGRPLGIDKEGNPIYEVKDTYRQFLNAAKKALGNRYLSFNPVGAQGIEQVDTSNSDVLYTEFWPWDTDRDGSPYNTYRSLTAEIERTMTESRPYSVDGKGKSLVVKAYINYDKTTGTTNTPGVLLCDAAVYAAGGSRLEPGDGNHMLHAEYYPDDNIPMGDDLQRDMEKLADFAVAYENLLRDGQSAAENKAEIKGYPVSADGQNNTIWTYVRADKEYDILHLINLLGTDNEWRDERGKKAEPTYAGDLQIKYYTEKEITQVQMASFSIANGMSSQLFFEKGRDANGGYLSFTVPGLKYWDMVYMR